MAFAAFLTLAIGFAQLQDVLPVTVQRFFEERSDRERISKIGHDNAISSQFAPSRMINGTEMVDAFIDIENKDVIKTLKAQGVIVNCEFGDFITAQIPVEKLAHIHHIPGVVNVEISRLVELCTDTTLSVTHAGQVIEGENYGLPQGYDGSGVVITVARYFTPSGECIHGVGIAPDVEVSLESGYEGLTPDKIPAGADAEKRTAGLFDSTIPPAACQREAMRKALRVCVK